MGSLAGRRVVVTRERPGVLAELLEARGATVVHVPLITVVDPDDGGAELAAALHGLGDHDWLVVTSARGAERVAAAAASEPAVRLGAVGTVTARVLAEGAGRPVDLVPERQIGTALVSAFAALNPTPQQVLVVQADRAAGDVVTGLRAHGHQVTAVVGYRTLIATPDDRDVAEVDAADAVVFASGSSIEGWIAAFGTHTPPVAVAIGPSTAAVADRLGLKLSGVAADHSLDGLVAELERHLAAPRDVPETCNNGTRYQDGHGRDRQTR